MVGLLAAGRHPADKVLANVYGMRRSSLSRCESDNNNAKDNIILCRDETSWTDCTAYSSVPAVIEPFSEYPVRPFRECSMSFAD